jgi:hypothetical protein
LGVLRERGTDTQQKTRLGGFSFAQVALAIT